MPIFRNPPRIAPAAAPREVVFQLYLRVARYGFRKHAAYRAAAVAGAFTNTVFGILRAYVLIALWEARPGLAGYDVAQAVTFCFLTQAFIGPMQVFGGGIELAERVRSGDAAIDLVRPASLQLWSLADDLGRAAYLFLMRSVPPTLAGAALFGIVVPPSPAAWGLVAVSVVLGIVVSFGVRYLLALSACWILDDRGLQQVALVLMMFFSGMVVPLRIIPGWLGALAEALPWAAMVQVPADVYLGATDVPRALAFQAAWAVALLALGALLTRAARRKVVIQGG
ncbi:ABC-2 type transport system permease protein [Thermocatellispora tengchongensis]|uniref:ABC-2 type transport system permease protein n=1 Tax=Thermocatellispora tengchongensis TaxID=1073253 RepID=A0A840P7V5_9ACTN|nr:ABC-2 family transporter protein [Thermocatellispora tengchongensis]MBB5132095.1 ABC-2 type transport system permease protein [Thermocatellispora tengchongensis]